jgi:tetratricopeptide (TPR) repeat protein
VVEGKLGREALLVDKPELAVCLGAAIYQVPSETDAKFYFLRGLKQAQADNYTDAIEEFNRAINLALNDAEAYYNRGLVHSKLDEQQQALEDYSRAIDLNPNYAEAYLNRGNIRYRLGDFEGAIRDYDLSLENNPNLTEAIKNRELVLRKQAEQEENIRNEKLEAIKSQLQLEEQAQVFYRQGLEKSQENDYWLAIESLEQALQLKADYAEVYYARAIIRHQLGDNRGAIEDLQEASKFFFNQHNFPEYQKALDKIQEINSTQRSTIDFESSIPKSTKSSQLTPQEKYQQGLTQSEQGNYQAAIETFEQLLQIDSDNIGAYLNRGLAYFCLEDYQKTIDDSTEALRINPNCADAYVCRGLGRFGIRDYQGAMQDFNQAIQKDVNHGGAYLGRSVLNAFLGDHHKAIADCNRLQQIDTQFNRVEHNHILAFAVQNNTGAIVKYFQKTAMRFLKEWNYAPSSAKISIDSEQKIQNNPSSTLQNYLNDRKQRFLVRDFTWNEAISYQDITFKVTARGNLFLLGIPWETFFTFADFTNLDIVTLRHFARNSFNYCKNSRESGLKIKGILCYPVALVEGEELNSIIAAIQKEPPTYEIDEFTRASFIFPAIFALSSQRLYLSEQRPFYNWSGWPGIKKIAQQMLQ